MSAQIDGSMFRGVEQTMLLPLWGRYSESRKENGLIRDEKCLEIAGKLGVDFSEIERLQNPASRLAWVARAWNMDLELRKLMAEGDPLTVVSLGCGLDTAFFRVDDGRLTWYDVDLPPVIEARKAIIGETPRCTMVAGSVLEADTFRGIRVKGRLVVLAVGLLYYFTGDDVKRIMANIASLAPRMTLIIDYCSAKGIEISNRIVIQNCSGAKMIWSAETEEDLRALNPGISAVGTYPQFRKIMPRLSGDEAKMAAMSDSVKIMSFAVIELGKA